jgi:hypothetical protein
LLSFTSSQASLNSAFATTGSNTFNGTQTLSGSLLTSGSITATGTITAQTLVVQTVTSSVSFITGSTKFGSLGINSHQFTGSVSVTGSLSSTSLTGSIAYSNLTGVPSGIVSGSSQIIYSSISSIPAGIVSGSSQVTGIGNAQLTNSTISGIALGSNLATLTIGTGLSGTSYNGSGAVTIANTGVTSNVAGTGITVSGATGAVTITNSGVTSIVAGTGISINQGTGAVTVTNTITNNNQLTNGAGYITSAGNAATVTNGVYTTGNQTIGGIKNFSENVGIGTTSPAYVLDVIGGSIVSRRAITSPRISSAGTYIYGVTNSPTWVLNLLTFTNNNVTSPDGNTSAGTYNLHASSYDGYQNLTGLTSGVEYTVGVWVKLGTATNFCIVINNTAAWNTIGGKSFDSSDGLSTSKWTHISYTFTATATGQINLHIGGHSESITQQTAGTVFLWNWEMTTASSTWVGKVDDEIRLPGSSIWSSRGSVGMGTTLTTNTAWGNDSNTRQLSIYSSGYAVINLEGAQGGTARKFSMGVGNNIFYMCYDNTAARHNLIINSDGLATFGGAITAVGDITAFSDFRLKENVLTITNPLSKVMSLRGVSYNRTDLEDKTKKIGFIAQEVKETVPEVVSYNEEQDRYGVSYGNVTALLVEAIKEQQTQIEELKTIINGLTK